MIKRIAIIGGGTNTYISNHLALSAPAYGTTAKTLKREFENHDDNKMQVDLYLTKMAGGNPIQSLQKNLDYNISKLSTHLTSCHRKLVEQRRDFYRDSLKHQGVFDTPEDVEALVDNLIADPDTRVIIFNVAMVDYKPTYMTEWRREDKTLGEDSLTFGKYEKRISTSGTPVIDLELKPYDKIINKIRRERKDILLVGFKTTCGATKEDMFNKGLKLCKDASANIVFVNDVDKGRINLLDNIDSFIISLKDRLQNHFSYSSKDYEETVLGIQLKVTEEFNSTYSDSSEMYTKELYKLVYSLFQNNGLVTPEESSYWYNTRDEALDGLVQMVMDRSHLHFTRSTVVDSDTLILNTLVISEVNEYGAISIKSRLGDAWIQDHFDFFLVDGIFGSKRINSLEEGVAYVKEQYLGQYKKLLQF